MESAEHIQYYASPTGSKFHRADQFVRAIMGPIGSGKSVTCIMDMLKHSTLQAPNKQGIRKTRWAVIRNTYRELIDTTIKTFFDWIPESSGLFVKMDMQFTMNTRLPDGTILYAEFLFRALDRPKDVKKLLSLELTGGFVNEAREVPLSVIEMLQGRCGRYPSAREGGPTWHGVIMDTNPPDADHWWYKLFEETRPGNHKLFRQPSGLDPKAENIKNLPATYYTNMVAGKNQEWVNVYVHGMYGFVSDGKPVFPEWNDDIHYTDKLAIRAVDTSALVGLYEIPNKPSTTIYVGIDFGLTPAAAIGLINKFGQLQIVDELCTFDMGAVSFGKLLKQRLSKPPYNNCTIEAWGDPSGDNRSQNSEDHEDVPFRLLAKQGIEAYPTFTNDPVIRREVVAARLQTLVANGKPALVLGPNAPMLRKAMGGGYKYKRMQVAGEDKWVEKPDKNRYSHIAEALEYLVLGADGDTNIIGGFGSSDEIDYSAQAKYYR